MVTQIELGDIAVDVVQKDIKNVHLSVYPPTGRVRIAAPTRMSLDTIRVFAISKLGWIKQQQQKLREQERETPARVPRPREPLRLGQALPAQGGRGRCRPQRAVAAQHAAPARPAGHGRARRGRRSLQSWYREQLKAAVPPLIAKWEPLLGVKVNGFFVQRMKTKWGSCNPTARTIRLNTELAKKPRECLEYIVVHEMVHLLEPTHNARFVALMDQFMPKWQFHRDMLNRLPVRHESWGY